MKKLYIETYGCQMNVADSEVVASVMKMAGYETCDNADEADAVFLNTCSVRDNAEQKIINRLEALNAMQNYSWPGNVRELFNTVDRIHTLGMSQKNLRVDDLRMESCFVSL